MDEAAGPDDVTAVFVEGLSELQIILSSQPACIIEQLCQRFPQASLAGIEPSASPDTARQESVKTMLDYFRRARPEECCHFLQTVCMLCENIPMWLESKLMAVTWREISKYQTMPSVLTLTLSLKHTYIHSIYMIQWVLYFIYSKCSVCKLCI